MDNLSHQKGSLNLPMVVVGNFAASEGSESRCDRSGDFYVPGGAACFHRYPQVVHRTLKLVTHEESQMESPRDDNLNLDNNDMYTVTICRCLVVQALC